MAKLENVEFNKEVDVAVQEIVKSTSLLRQAKSEFLVMLRTLIYYLSVRNFENFRERPDSLNQHTIGKEEDIGAKGADIDKNDKNDEDIEEITAEIDKEEDNSVSNETGCWSIEIIEEEEKEQVTCLCFRTEDWLGIFIYFSMLVLVAALIVLFFFHDGPKLKQ